jgi:type IV fimbrial biogenesis protein FimT
MLITVTIVGVLLAIAAPSFRQMTLNHGIRTASFDLFSALEYARSEAIKRNNTVSVKPNSTWSTGWKVVDASNNLLRAWTSTSTVAVSTTPSSIAAITFGKDGHVTVPSSVPKLQLDPTTTMNGVDSRCISVDLIGRPKTQTGACS